MPVTFTVKKDRLDTVGQQLKSRTRTAVDDTARAIRTLGSQIAPRDTGSLSASLYTGTPDGSDYGQASSAARALNPQAEIVDEVRSEFVLSLSGGDDSLYVDVVGVAVAHGIFQELGTRYQSAQPFLLPAVENERGRFLSRMRGIADD